MFPACPTRQMGSAVVVVTVVVLVVIVVVVALGSHCCHHHHCGLGVILILAVVTRSRRRQIDYPKHLLGREMSKKYTLKIELCAFIHDMKQDTSSCNLAHDKKTRD